MRCKACNNIMTAYEIIWIIERNEFEDLCRKCRDRIGVEDELSLTHNTDLFEMKEGVEDDAG